MAIERFFGRTAQLTAITGQDPGPILYHSELTCFEIFLVIHASCLTQLRLSGLDSKKLHAVLFVQAMLLFLSAGVT